MNELSYWKGNSFLRSIMLGYNATGILATTLTYTHMRDMFVSVHGGGFQRTKFVWQVNVGVQRKALHDKGTLRAGISDLFQTYRWASIRDYDGMYYRTQGSEDSRQLKLGFSYRFGNVKMAQERNRNSGLENESRRVK